MFLTTLLVSAQQATQQAADTTVHKLKFTEKLAELSDMSLRQVVEQWFDLHRNQNLHCHCSLFYRPMVDPLHSPGHWAHYGKT